MYQNLKFKWCRKSRKMYCFISSPSVNIFIACSACLKRNTLLNKTNYIQRNYNLLKSETNFPYIKTTLYWSKIDQTKEFKLTRISVPWKFTSRDIISDSQHTFISLNICWDGPIVGVWESTNSITKMVVTWVWGNNAIRSWLIMSSYLLPFSSNGVFSGVFLGIFLKKMHSRKYIVIENITFWQSIPQP